MVAVLGLAAVFFPSCREADPEHRSKGYDLTVIIVDNSSRPVPNAKVVLSYEADSSQKTDDLEKRTDETGKCIFTNMKSLGGKVVVSTDTSLPMTYPFKFEEWADRVMNIPLAEIPLYLTVNNDSIDAYAREQADWIEIKSNTDWRIESTSDWLSFSPREGFGDETVKVSWSFPKGLEDSAVAEFTILSAVNPVAIPVRYHPL
jgi:hypothetical protein